VNLTTGLSEGKSWSKEERNICFQLHLPDQSKLRLSLSFLVLLLPPPRPMRMSHSITASTAKLFSLRGNSSFKKSMSYFSENGGLRISCVCVARNYTLAFFLARRHSYLRIQSREYALAPFKTLSCLTPIISLELYILVPHWDTPFSTLRKWQPELFSSSATMLRKKREVYLCVLALWLQNFWSTGRDGVTPNIIDKL